MLCKSYQPTVLSITRPLQRYFNTRLRRRPRLIYGCLLFAASGAMGQPCIPIATQPVPPLEEFWLTDLVAFDDGSGWALWAAGYSPYNRAMRWDGVSWSFVEMAATVNRLVVFDDGTGPALYMSGSRSGSGVLARWDGQAWTRFDDAINGPIGALAVFDDGTGPALYFGGHFTQVAGIPASRIARWDGQNFSALGAGLNFTPTLRGMAAFDDDPAGPALYVGGAFTMAGGIPVNRIARWDGHVWSAVGDGTNGTIYPLTAFNDGSGPAIYASGDFSTPASRFARWDGYSWSEFGQPMNGVAFAFATLDHGYGPSLYAAGEFTSVWHPYVARWDGSQWLPVLDFVAESHGSRITATNDGAPALYIGFNSTSRATFARWGCVPEPKPCYPNCDGSTAPPILNVDDFVCFINEFAGAQQLPHVQQLEHYANCDNSTSPPVLTVDDFTCFINAFAAGCR